MGSPRHKILSLFTISLNQRAAEISLSLFSTIFRNFIKNVMTSIFPYTSGMELYDKPFRCMEVKLGSSDLLREPIQQTRHIGCACIELTITGTAKN